MKERNPAKSSIVATLVYADIFDYPLTKEEIWEWLIETGDGKTKKLKNKKTFDADMDFLLAGKKIGQKGNYLFLNGRSGLVETRKRREVWSRKKIKRAENIAGILRRIPWIRLIGLTGALARNNARHDDDIDLFFIIKENRLWLTRGIVVVLLRLLGLYRRPDKINNRVCTNMFVSEETLKMSPEDLFIAHEVCLMKPLFSKGNTYQRFLEANLWVGKFLPHKFFGIRHQELGIDPKKDPPAGGPITSFLEHFAKKAQLYYMRKKRTCEIVSDNLIKFHPQNVRKQVLAEYKNRISRIL